MQTCEASEHWVTVPSEYDDPSTYGCQRCDQLLTREYGLGEDSVQLHQPAGSWCVVASGEWFTNAAPPCASCGGTVVVTQVGTMHANPFAGCMALMQ